MTAKQEGEQAARVEAAKNLLKMNLGTVEQIAQAEGLSIEQVKELENEVMASQAN